MDGAASGNPTLLPARLNSPGRGDRDLSLKDILWNVPWDRAGEGIRKRVGVSPWVEVGAVAWRNQHQTRALVWESLAHEA